MCDQFIPVGHTVDCVPEELLFETEADRSRADVASLLRTVADNLEAGDPITLEAGDDSVTVSPPAHPTFEVAVEREGPEGGPTELSVEFELEWPEDGGDGSGELRVE